MAKQTDPNTPVAPTIALPLYDETVSTDGHFQNINPAAGSKFITYATLPGQRSHNGEITTLFEPNTAAHLINVLLLKGSTTGTDPATHPYTLGLDSASYTYDVSLGNIVKRIWGVKASKFGINWQDNEAQAKLSISGLGSFDGREILSISGSGPYTIVLKDPNGIYDGAPTKGLIVGDAIRFYDLGTSAYVCDATVATITDGITFTFTLVSGSTTLITAGDAVHLRPVTPTYNNLQSFLWSKTRFYFAATAAAALALPLTSHTPLEIGTEWEVSHGFVEDEGSKRSGSHDPASLDRLFGDATFKIKKLTDSPEDLLLFKNLNKTACVVRMFSGLTNQYEFRLTLNALITDKPLGSIKAGELIFSELDMKTNVSQADAQAFDIKVLNAITTGL
jgi:hypothetical protein